MFAFQTNKASCKYLQMATKLKSHLEGPYLFLPLHPLTPLHPPKRMEQLKGMFHGAHA